jgi:amidase
VSEFAWTDATELAARLARREVRAVELMAACYDQIERLNPLLNAIVNLLPRSEALRLAEAADRDAAAGRIRGPLHGLPMAAKDTVDVAGFPTTWGFRPWAGRIAREDGLLAARQRAAGALFIGKTNMPEFALGSHTFNSLFGTTRNPYDPRRSAGGSSGGAAVALATGMLPLADGSDMGGSLRNPASFCNVVGFRPSIGRVPDPRAFGWMARLATSGPMARTVADAALLLSVQAGPHPDDPLAFDAPGDVFRTPLDGLAAGLRLAWCRELPGVPVEPAVAAVIAAAARTLADLGCQLTEDAPDSTGAMEVFRVQRAAALGVTGRQLDVELPEWRRHAKETAVWNMDEGRRLSADQLIDAELQRTRLHRDAARFFERYDALLLPSAPVPPFPVETEWVRRINGVTLSTYIDWMAVCCIISVLGLPAISVPAGFTPAGLPVGLQIVGPPRGDLSVLRIAHAFEQATGYGRRRPALALEAAAGDHGADTRPDSSP